MKTPVLIGLLVGGAALLAACVRVERGGPPLVVSVKRDGDGCRVMVEGEAVTSDRLTDIGRSAKARRAIVLHDKDTPFKCIGGAVLTLQRAGLDRIHVAMWDGS